MSWAGARSGIPATGPSSGRSPSSGARRGQARCSPTPPAPRMQARASWSRRRLRGAGQPWAGAPGGQRPWASSAISSRLSRVMGRGRIRPVHEAVPWRRTSSRRQPSLRRACTAAQRARRTTRGSRMRRPSQAASRLSSRTARKPGMDQASHSGVLVRQVMPMLVSVTAPQPATKTPTAPRRRARTSRLRTGPVRRPVSARVPPSICKVPAPTRLRPRRQSRDQRTRVRGTDGGSAEGTAAGAAGGGEGTGSGIAGGYGAGPVLLPPPPSGPLSAPPSRPLRVPLPGGPVDRRRAGPCRPSPRPRRGGR